MKRGISCESFVRFERNYAQEISRVLAFFIAAWKEFFQISDGTRKRRAVEPLGSLGWTRFIQGGFARAKIARMASGSPRAIASRRGRQSSGVDRLSRRHARATSGRDGGLGFFREDLPSGRSALFPAQCGGSDRLRPALGRAAAERCAWAWLRSDPG